MNRNFEIETHHDPELEKIAKQEMLKKTQLNPIGITEEEAVYSAEYQRLGLEHDSLMEQQVKALASHEYELAADLLLHAQKVLDDIHRLEISHKKNATMVDLEIKDELERLQEDKLNKPMN